MRNYSYLCAKILKTMRKVIGIGETVLDIIFRDEQPISALPGGWCALDTAHDTVHNMALNLHILH